MFSFNKSFFHRNIIIIYIYIYLFIKVLLTEELLVLQIIILFIPTINLHWDMYVIDMYTLTYM